MLPLMAGPVLLAVGGGSAIDTAKAIAVGAPYDGDLWDFFCKKPAEVSLPVGVVLTLSGTGSEASDSTVITNENGNLKCGNLKSDVFRPAFAVMNPRYTCSLPAYQTASGATDMLSHIMERYFTPTEHVDVTDRLCEGLMKTILTAAGFLQKKSQKSPSYGAPTAMALAVSMALPPPTASRKSAPSRRHRSMPSYTMPLRGLAWTPPSSAQGMPASRREAVTAS